MGKEAKQMKSLFHEVIEYVRLNHAESIDKAYEYFWDKENPEDYMGGNALKIGFHNFEDWMLYDHKVNEEGETFIDLYIKNKKDLPEDAVQLLNRCRDSVVSLYEVTSVSKDKRVLLKDVLLESEADIREKALTHGLKKGDLFATRILKLDGNDVMSGCVYPYLPTQKKQVLAYISKQFSRYVRNVKKNGTMREYLKDYGDVFNLIWMNFIIEPKEKEE
jgi:hypothetical protein